MEIHLISGLLVYLSAFYGRVEAVDGTVQSFDTSGQNCLLQEPIYDQKFDLNPLKSDLGHTVKSLANDVLKFNVCGKLGAKCGNHTNVNACLQKPDGRQVVIGFNESLFLSDGRMHFNFTGERCNDKQNYSLNVILNCDYDTHEQPLTVFPYTNVQCIYYVMWTTDLACFKEPKGIEQNACSVKDSDGHVFDLLPLSHENKKIKVGTNHILINVCKPVLYKHLEMCPPGSSVCMVNRTDDNLRYVNLGNVVANPTLENDRPVMKLVSDTKCNATANYRTTIYFECDELNEYGDPVLRGFNDCEYEFEWSTILACKRHIPCGAIDQTTGFRFDMSSLAQRSYNLTRDGKNYFFSVCSETLEPCAGKAGACLTNAGHMSTSLGVTTDFLHYNVTGAPYLLYEKGAKCNDVSSWSTKIEFLCASTGLKEGPHIIEEKDCQLLIQFVTELACQTNLSCRVQSYADGDTDGQVIDLSRLIKTNGNYEATVNETLMQQQKWNKPTHFYLNVCRALVPQYGLNCAGGSAACKATRDNNTQTAEEEEGLGFPDVSLTLVDTDHGQRPQLRYLRGSACAADPTQEQSTQIEFHCQESAGLGNPILQNIVHGCHYDFEWATNIMCPSFYSKKNDRDCVIHNEQIGRSLNLKDVFESKTISLKDDKKGTDQIFNVDICDENRTVTINYKESTVQVFIKADGKCGNENTFDVELRLVCYKTPQRYSEREGSSCRMLFTQETPLICPLLGIDSNSTLPVKQPNQSDHQSTSPVVGKPIDDSTDAGSIGSPYMIGLLAAVLAITTVVLSVVFVLKDAERRQRVMSLFRRRGPSVQYSRVRSNEEANLLLDHPMSISDSDDELLI